MRTRAKPSARKRAIKSLDTAFSLYIRARDRVCVTCGATENLACGHVLSRTSYGTRWDETNAFCQCSGCNLLHEHNPAPLTLVFLRKYGQDAYERLQFRWGQTKKYTADDLEWLAGYWRAKAKQVRVDEDLASDMIELMKRIPGKKGQP